jgi:membrane-bound ClpP family serine protease
MWVVAGVLLGMVVLATLVGLHTGPHAHVVAGALGGVAAVWMVVMLADGKTRPLLLALLAADVVVSGGVGFAAWRALSGKNVATNLRSLRAVEGSMGVAVGELAPSGIVRVRGESWSATSLNGPIHDGDTVQVVSIDGVRLSVWRDESITEAGGLSS